MNIKTDHEVLFIRCPYLAWSKRQKEKANDRPRRRPIESSGAVVVHGGGHHPERAVPGVPEPHRRRGLDPPAVADEVVAALAPEEARVDGDRAREALGAEGHAADGAAAPVPHRHLEHRVVPGLLPRVHRLHLHARRRALPCRRCWPRPRHRHRPRSCTADKSELRCIS
jgi:hypothetical protein